MNHDLYTATDPAPAHAAIHAAGPAEPGSRSALAADFAAIVHGTPQLPLPGDPRAPGGGPTTPVVQCPDCTAVRTGGGHRCLPGRGTENQS